MILDKNGKLFGKINIIDVAVILVAIAVVIGVFVRFTGGAGKIVKETKKIEYVVQISGVRGYTVDALEKKGLVTDKKYAAVVGEITNVEKEPAIHESTMANGEIKKVSLPEKYDCMVTITTDGKESDNGYFNNNNDEISVGRDYSLYSKYVSTTGVIKSVKVVG